MPSNPRLHRGRGGTVANGTGAVLARQAATMLGLRSAVCAVMRWSALAYQEIIGPRKDLYAQNRRRSLAALKEMRAVPVLR